MMVQQMRPVLYVSAEESVQQIARRFRNFPNKSSTSEDNLFIVSENRLNAILDNIEKTKPHVVVIDSIQMIFSEVEDHVKGGVASLREVTEALVSEAKSKGF